MEDKTKIQLAGFETKEDTKSLYKVVKNNPKDKIELELGDSKNSTEIFPQAKIVRWDNEVNLSIRYKDDQVETTGKGVKPIEPVIRTEGSNLIWSKDKREVHIYEKPEVGEDGGLEIEVVLAEKPISNVIEFTIETKGLDFFYQPELTQEEKDKGANRPENVIGSYAVYHKGKSGNFTDKEYKTGKAFHIYRPKVTDADGKEIWGELNVDETGGLLTITVDEKWLSKAVYPVLIDPTFGYTSVGGSNGTVAPCEGTLFTSPSDITQVDSISVYASMGSGPPSDTLKMAVYKQSDMTLVSNSLTSTITINSPSAGSWRTHSYSTKPTISSSTNYLLSFQCLTWSYIDFYYDSGDTNQLYEGVYGSFTIGDSPWSSDNYTRRNYKYSIYATYTASVSGTAGSSERLLYLTGKSTGNSERSLYVIGSVSANSERAMYLTGSIANSYSMENASDLEGDNSTLGTVFSEQNYTDVGSDNDVYVDIPGILQYSKFLFKEYNNGGADTDSISITWKGKSSLAPSSATAYLQIYNYTTPGWENLDTESVASANTEFTLSGAITTSTSDYYDGNLVISCRVYQEVL